LQDEHFSQFLGEISTNPRRSAIKLCRVLRIMETSLVPMSVSTFMVVSVSMLMVVSVFVTVTVLMIMRVFVSVIMSVVMFVAVLGIVTMLVSVTTNVRVPVPMFVIMLFVIMRMFVFMFVAHDCIPSHGIYLRPCNYVGGANSTADLKSSISQVIP
jgi:hypothetical protein